MDAVPIVPPLFRGTKNTTLHELQTGDTSRATDMMFRRKKTVLLILDSLPAHKAKIVKDYVASTEGKLEFHFLPGYAPELNPDEMVWNYMKRTGTARKPLAKGESLHNRIDVELQQIQGNRALVRSFFRAESVSYISD